MRNIITIVFFIIGVGFCSAQKFVNRQIQYKAEIEYDFLNGVVISSKYAFEISLPVFISAQSKVTGYSLEETQNTFYRSSRQAAAAKRSLELRRNGRAVLVLVDNSVLN